MRLFGKPKEEEKPPETEKELHDRIRKRLGRIRKGEKIDRTKGKDLEDLVGGLAHGDG